MKIKRLIVALLLFNLGLSAQNKEIDIESKIKHVTVYLNGAEVERSANKRLEKGVHYLTFPGLSQNINEKSIQVNGKGYFTILSVSKKRNYLKKMQETPEYKSLSDSLDLIKDELWYHQELKKVYHEEQQMILANKKIDGTSASGFTVQKLEELSNFYRKRLKEIMTLKMENTRKELELQATINRLQNQMNEISRIRSYSSEILVEVAVDQPTTAKFNLKYLVSGARWTPQYNVRAQSSKENVDLAFNAQIFQSTGVSWENVELSLSTANPSVSPIMPKLNPWRLYFQTGRVQGNMTYSNRVTQFSNAKMESADVVEDEMASAPNAGTASQHVRLTESQLNLTYDINIPYTVPNDGIAHMVNVKNMSLPAKFNYSTAPKLKTNAYLLASISGWENESLISGSANVYFDGTYIGSSYIDANNTDKDLKISMGIDKQIVVTRKRIQDFCEKQTIGPNKKETIGIEVMVKNTKMRPIKLKVKEQIPLSSNEEIEVELLESTGAKFNEQNGELIWDLELAPGESKKMIFKYSIKYPKDKMINL